MAKLSNADKTYLSETQQAQISKLKQDWADANAAGDTAGMQKANREAEAIRASAGYSGGSDGSGFKKLSAASGGQTAEQVQSWVDDYYKTNLDGESGWINGYSAEMNKRSMANYIRQQMQANSDAWSQADEAGKQYLHEQNVALAQILSDAAGGVQSKYNETLGRWETENANLGYGYNIGAYNDVQWAKEHYGMTDEQIDSYRNDTDRYRNFVDQALIRNRIDESGGYTGRYAQFVDGPYGQLLAGTNGVNIATYTDVVGDGFGKEADALYQIPTDGEGNIVAQAPLLKNNNSLNDYTRQFTSYVDENGIIQPGQLVLTNPGGGSTGAAATGLSHIPQAEEARQVSGTGTLEQWQQSAMAQAAAARDHAVDLAVQELLLAQAQAQQQYKTRRDQIAREELQALDNSALYAETRGDRGGIGRSQYDYIQAQADANRQAVSDAQVQMATQTAQQIAKLRAEGEFEKADDMMEVSQTYLLKLLDMEQWAAEYGLDTAKFEESIRQWEQEYRLSLAKTLI